MLSQALCFLANFATNLVLLSATDYVLHDQFYDTY